MEEPRREEGAQHHADVPPEPLPRVATEHDECLAEELVPVLRPEAVHRVRLPRIVHDGRPRERGAVKEPHSDEGDEVIDHVKACKNSRAGDDVDGGGHDVTCGYAEVRVKNGTAHWRANPGEELDERFKEVKKKIVINERLQGGAKKG